MLNQSINYESHDNPNCIGPAKRCNDGTQVRDRHKWIMDNQILLQLRTIRITVRITSWR
jgi:hypothetical protein